MHKALTFPKPARALFCGLCVVILAACTEQHHKPLTSTEVARKGVHGGALSVDGEYTVIGSIFDGGSFWRNSDGERLYNWNHSTTDTDRIILSADIDPTKTRAMTTDSSTIVLWDINSGEATRFWTSPAEILDSKLSAGGRYALLGLADHSAVIFDIVRGGIVRSLYHQGRVRSVDISADNTLAITGSEDHSAALWKVETGELLMTMPYEEDVQLVKLSRDGRYALTAAQYDRVEIWDTYTQTSLAVLPLKKQQLKRGLRVTAAQFSEDKQELLLGYPNQIIELRELPSLTLKKTWRLPKRNQWQPTPATVLELVFDKKSDHYHALSSDGFVHLLN